MKKLFLAVLALVAIVAFAAVGPTYTQQYAYVQLSNCAPGYTAGTVTQTSATVSSSLTGHFVNDADPTDSHDLTILNFSFDLMDAKLRDKTVTVGKATVTYGQLALLMTAACAQEGGVQQAAVAAARIAK